MKVSKRRPRKRKPTSSGRFIGSNVAYEIGLLRLAVEAQKEFFPERNKENDKREK